MKLTIEQERQITAQYQYIKELATLKYDAEEKREQNLIQQSSQMQTAFSFMTAAVFAATAICIEYRGKLTLNFFLIAVSVVTFLLIVSLLLASLAQWRWKTEAFPDILDMKDKYRVLSCGRLDAVFPSCVKLVVAKISGIIMRTLKKEERKWQRLNFKTR